MGGHTIGRGNLDATDAEALFAHPYDRPASIALDVTNAKMSWVDSRPRKLRRANMDATGIEDLVTGISASGITLDLRGHKVYWTGSGQIQRATEDCKKLSRSEGQEPLRA